MMRAYGGGPGLDYLFARFKPRLDRELGRDLSQQIFVENPRRVLAFEPRLRTAPSGSDATGSDSRA
jgi:hypothetical protein